MVPNMSHMLYCNLILDLYGAESEPHGNAVLQSIESVYFQFKTSNPSVLWDLYCIVNVKGHLIVLYHKVIFALPEGCTTSNHTVRLGSVHTKIIQYLVL
jgi:hypothetical protein